MLTPSNSPGSLNKPSRTCTNATSGGSHLSDRLLLLFHGQAVEDEDGPDGHQGPANPARWLDSLPRWFDWIGNKHKRISDRLCFLLLQSLLQELRGWFIQFERFDPPHLKSKQENDQAGHEELIAIHIHRQF